MLTKVPNMHVLSVLAPVMLTEVPKCASATTSGPSHAYIVPNLEVLSVLAPVFMHTEVPKCKWYQFYPQSKEVWKRSNLNGQVVSQAFWTQSCL